MSENIGCNTATASFNTAVRQTTEMFQQKMTNVSQRKKQQQNGMYPQPNECQFIWDGKQAVYLSFSDLSHYFPVAERKFTYTSRTGVYASARFPISQQAIVTMQIAEN